MTKDRRHLFASGLGYKTDNRELAVGHARTNRRRKHLAAAVLAAVTVPPIAFVLIYLFL